MSEIYKAYRDGEHYTVSDAEISVSVPDVSEQEGFGDFEDYGPDAIAQPLGTVGPTGWVPPEKELAYFEWALEGVALRSIHRGAMWAIGDWLNYGEIKFQEAFVQAADMLGYSPGYLRQMKWVSAAFPDRNMRAQFSFSSCRAVAPLTPEHRDRFLALARDNGWTSSELEEKVRDWRREAKGVMREHHVPSVVECESQPVVPETPAPPPVASVAAKFVASMQEMRTCLYFAQPKTLAEFFVLDGRDSLSGQFGILKALLKEISNEIGQ